MQNLPPPDDPRVKLVERRMMQFLTRATLGDINETQLAQMIVADLFSTTLEMPPGWKVFRAPYHVPIRPFNRETDVGNVYKLPEVEFEDDGVVMFRPEHTKHQLIYWQRAIAGKYVDELYFNQKETDKWTF